MQLVTTQHMAQEWNGNQSVKAQPSVCYCHTNIYYE